MGAHDDGHRPGDEAAHEPPRPAAACARADRSAPRGTRARRGARLSHRARDPEARRERPEPGGGARAGPGALWLTGARRRRMPRRARHRVRRHGRPGRVVCLPHLPPVSAGGADHRRHRVARPGPGRRRLRVLQRVGVPRRQRAAISASSSPSSGGSVPGADDRLRFTRGGLRGNAPGDQRLLRCLRAADGSRFADRRADDGGRARHRELLSDARRQSGARPRLDSGGRYPPRRQTGAGPQPQGMVATLRGRPGCRRAQRAGQRISLRDRRRHAGRLSRARRRRTRLLGAAGDARSVPTATRRP